MRSMVLCGRVLIANGEGSWSTDITFSLFSCSEHAGNWHQARCVWFRTSLHMASLWELHLCWHRRVQVNGLLQFLFHSAVLSHHQSQTRRSPRWLTAKKTPKKFSQFGDMLPACCWWQPIFKMDTICVFDLIIFGCSFELMDGCFWCQV